MTNPGIPQEKLAKAFDEVIRSHAVLDVASYLEDIKSGKISKSNEEIESVSTGSFSTPEDAKIKKREQLKL